MRTALYHHDVHFALLHLDIACLDQRAGALCHAIADFHLDENLDENLDDSADPFVQKY